MALQVSPYTWRVCMEWVVRGALGGVALKQPPDVLMYLVVIFVVFLVFTRVVFVFSGSFCVFPGYLSCVFWLFLCIFVD